MSPSSIEVTTCGNCKRKFSKFYLRCPYCKTKNPAKSKPQEKTKEDPTPEQKCLCLDPIHAGDNPNCPIHGGQS
jgi:DNA-directed RNA polymerase subunit RPC12/RpoP